MLFAGSRSRSSLEYVTIPREHWHDVGFGLLVASYVLILAFAARNLVLRGMGIVFIGIACNALVITLNQGMPVKIPAEWQSKSWAQPTVKHHPQQPDDKLRFLSDIIVLKEPVRLRRSASATSSSRSACATSRTTRAASRSGAAPGTKTAGHDAGIDLDEREAAASTATDRRRGRSGGGADPVAQHALQGEHDPIVVDVRRRRAQRLDRELAGHVVAHGQVVVLAREAQGLHREPALRIVDLAGDDLARRQRVGGSRAASHR